MMKKILFLYNPNAGMGKLKGKLADVIDIFTKAGYMVTAYPTQKRLDAVEKIQCWHEHFDLIVCSGGDGTLDETVTGMLLGNVNVPLGYIPAGTTNDFATSLGISKDMLESAETAVCGEPFACDIGKFQDDYFVYIAAFGLFTDVSYETDQNVKNVLGHLAYLLEGAKRVFNIPSYKMKVIHDGEIIEDEFMFGMVTNSRSVGGFKGIIGPEIQFDDGVFEVTLIKTPKNPIELNELLGAILLKQLDSKTMYSFKAKEIRFECEEAIPWTLDGEFGGTHQVAVVKNIKEAISIKVKKEVIEKSLEANKKNS